MLTTCFNNPARYEMHAYISDVDQIRTSIFSDEIDLWHYLLFVMSCLFVEQMCIG